MERTKYRPRDFGSLPWLTSKGLNMKCLLSIFIALSASVSLGAEKFKTCGDFGVTYDETSLKLIIRSNDRSKSRPIIEGFAVWSKFKDLENNWKMVLSSGHGLEQKTEPPESSTHKFTLTIPADPSVGASGDPSDSPSQPTIINCQ